MKKRAYRNTQDNVIAGVCSGLGEYFGIDPLFIRIVFLLFLFEPQIAVIAYIALWIALPKKPLESPDLTEPTPSDKPKSAFEQQIEEFGKEAETLGKEFEQSIEAKAEEFEEKARHIFTHQKVKIDIALESQPEKGKAFGIILIALGCIFMAHNYLPDFYFDKFWPIILIAIGISILFSGKKEKSS